MPSISIVAAFGAGALSFLSPCVFPLVPGYLSFLSGTGAGQASSGRRAAVVAALAFSLGFGLVFVALGASASALGRLVGGHRQWLEIGGGLVILLFGAHLLGLFRFTPLMRDTRILRLPKPQGPFGAVLVGAAFGFGWSPCIGPLLGGVLTLAATRETMGQGVGLLTSYALGLAVPFVGAALAMEAFIRQAARFRPLLPWVERASGAFLMLFGLLLLTGRTGWLAGLVPGIEGLAL